MKTSFKPETYLISALSLVFLFLCTAATYFANADLKGEWTYSETKSKVEQQNFRIAPLKLKITTEANGIAMERTSAGFNGGANMVTTDHLTFDGKESESPAFGTSKKKSTAAWSADGKQLTVSSSISFNQGGNTTEIKSTEIYSLSADGKNLTVAYNSTSSFGTFTGTFVYDKTN